MKPQDSLQDWRKLPLSHLMGEGRGEGSVSLSPNVDVSEHHPLTLRRGEGTAGALVEARDGRRPALGALYNKFSR